MKRIYMCILLFFLTGNLAACQSAEDNDGYAAPGFDEETLQNLKEQAKIYSDKDLQEGKVPLNEYIQISGEIIQSDSKTDKIKKGDRLILLSEESQYQVFNEQGRTLKIEDQVTVYGEYYGFVKGILIEEKE